MVLFGFGRQRLRRDRACRRLGFVNQTQAFKVCPRCQAPASLNAGFCSQCGHRFGASGGYSSPPGWPVAPTKVPMGWGKISAIIAACCALLCCLSVVTNRRTTTPAQWAFGVAQYEVGLRVPGSTGPGLYDDIDASVIESGDGWVAVVKVDNGAGRSFWEVRLRSLRKPESGIEDFQVLSATPIRSPY